jgi:hypothetical protein
VPEIAIANAEELRRRILDRAAAVAACNHAPERASPPTAPPTPSHLNCLQRIEFLTLGERGAQNETTPCLGTTIFTPKRQCLRRDDTPARSLRARRAPRDVPELQNRLRAFLERRVGTCAGGLQPQWREPPACLRERSLRPALCSRSVSVSRSASSVRPVTARSPSSPPDARS